MANQALRTALDSADGADVYGADEKRIIIAEEDPKHPNHAEHMLRVDPDDPDNIALLASLREHGWPRAKTIAVWKDGKGDRARFVVSDGRRSLTFTRIENARRKREKDPRGLIRPRVVLDDDPLLTETLFNSMRKDDPPMVKARRFRELKAGGMSGMKAAAALGLSLKDATDLDYLASQRLPELHAAVNGKAIDIGTAAKAAKDGSETVAAVLADAKDEATGKVEPKRARRAVKAAHTPRAKTLRAATLAEAERLMRKGADTPMTQAIIAVLCLAQGKYTEALMSNPVRALLDAMGYDADKGRLPTGKTGPRRAK